MKHSGKIFAIVISVLTVIAMTATCAFADGVTGIYSVTYGTQDISGNVRHTGYVTSQGSQEKNTVELKDDGTYVYTKLLTNDADILSGAAEIPEVEVEGAEPEVKEEAPEAAPAEGELLFSWEPNNEGEKKGSCTLDFYSDGKYVFEFPGYGLKEEGTWEWANWNMTLTRPDGVTLKPEMDESHSLYFDYLAAANDALHQNFIVASSAWGVKLGQTGSYTPAAGAETGVKVSAHYAGTATKKTADGNDYEATLDLFLLSDGNAYVSNVTPSSKNVSVGTWEEKDGTTSVAVGKETANVDNGKLVIEEVELTVSENMPEEYQDADWAALIADAKKTSFGGPIVLCYVFTGNYTADGDTVTLEAPTGCSWSENWGLFRSQGFHNGKGDETSKVFPKGATDKYFYAIDHFNGPYIIAPSHLAADENAPTEDIIPTVLELDTANMTFEYVIESAFD